MLTLALLQISLNYIIVRDITLLSFSSKASARRNHMLQSRVCLFSRKMIIIMHLGEETGNLKNKLMTFIDDRVGNGLFHIDWYIPVGIGKEGLHINVVETKRS